jgi:lipopolysaccharide transport system permease protein
MPITVWTNIKNLVRYRYLIKSLVSQTLRSRYRGSVIGFFWSFLNPLLLMLVYTLVFSVYMRVEIENYAAYLFCGLLPWIWFSSSLSEGVNSIIQGSTLLTKVPFPPEVLPTVPVISNLVNFLLGLVILFAFLLFLGIKLGIPLVFLPILISLQFLFTLGLALVSSALNVFFRDVQHILGNFLTLWFFLCPIIYPVSLVPERLRPLLFLNPLGVMMIAYQDILFYHRFPDPNQLVIVFLASIVSFYFGYLVFDRYRKTIAEEI